MRHTELAQELLRRARSKGLMIATAESCTGGLVSGAITDIAGSSDVFDRGFVTYSYDAKHDLLGVPDQMLEAHGAVSEQVARAMAVGALKNSRAHLSIAITGVAGPGSSETKPEGLVWFATSTRFGINSTCREFGPLGRDNVRQHSVKTALELGLQALELFP